MIVCRMCLNTPSRLGLLYLEKKENESGVVAKMLL